MGVMDPEDSGVSGQVEAHSCSPLSLSRVNRNGFLNWLGGTYDPLVMEWFLSSREDDADDIAVGVGTFPFGRMFASTSTELHLTVRA